MASGRILGVDIVRQVYQENKNGFLQKVELTTNWEKLFRTRLRRKSKKSVFNSLIFFRAQGMLQKADNEDFH